MKTEDKTEDDIILSALEREHTRLKKAADKAKSMSDKCMNAPTQLIEINREACQILLGETGGINFERLKELKKHASEAEKFMKLDLVKLLNKQFLVEFERNCVAKVLADHKFFMAMRRGK